LVTFCLFMASFQLKLHSDFVGASYRRRGVADLSQDGKYRSKPSVDHYMALFPFAYAGPINPGTATAPSGLPLPPALLAELKDAKVPIRVRVSYSWAEVKGDKVDRITKLQEALRPKDEPDAKEIVSDSIFAAGINELKLERAMNWASVASAINATIDHKIPAYEGMLDALRPGRAADGSEDLLNAASLDDVNAASLVSVEPILSQLSELVKMRYERLASSFWTDAQWQANYAMSPLRRNAEMARSKLMVNEFKPPAWFTTDVLDTTGAPAKNPFALNRLVVQRKLVEPAATATEDEKKAYLANPWGADVTLAEETTPMGLYLNMTLAEEIFWLAIRSQVTVGTDDQKDNFASTRLMIARNGWYHDSEEVRRPTGGIHVAWDTSRVDAMVSLQEHPELYEIPFAVALISYMESGHHANAFNISKKAARISSALGMPRDAAFWEANKDSMIYHGTHPADLRLVLASYRLRAASGNLTFAIARRLTRPAPGTAAYINLSHYIEALAATPFFAATDRERELTIFRQSIARIKSKNWAKAPYSAYLYGESIPLDPGDDQVMSHHAAYAAAIKDVMPDSTIGMSPALSKLAENAAVNSVTAKLHVGAFVKAYKEFLERIVRRRLAGDTGVRQLE
jgi:hypothetical protein